MLDDMLEGIRAAIFEDDYELAQVLVDEACKYAQRHDLVNDYLIDLSLVAYAPVMQEFVAAGVDVMYAGAAMELYEDVVRAAKDIGLPEGKISKILGETVH